jgi:hemerythrin-like domain-containing protein
MTTSNAPSLLNDDGSASVATALMMTHHALRRDIAEFAMTLRRLAEGGLANVAALQEEWRSYRNTLHGHHEMEDRGLFPHLRQQQPDMEAVIGQLASDHQRIDPLLEKGDRAFAELHESTDGAIAVVAEISALLGAHLAMEEAHVVPFLRKVKAFPPPSSDADVEMFVQGFAWSSHGIASEVLEQLGALLPPPVVSKLPDARAAFEKRYERVWGSGKTGASRTSVPDWLAGRR